MPGIYDITPKTYIRPNDMINEDLEFQIFQKAVFEFSDQEWYVSHNLHSTNLLINIWKYTLLPTSYYEIRQVDYDHMVVKWTAPTDGKIVLYAVRNFAGVSLVWEQSTPKDEWLITHNFGTMDLLLEVWSDGLLLMVPETRELVDVNTVKLTFAAPVSGKAILLVLDPRVSPGVNISWNQVTDKPETFPPDLSNTNLYADDSLKLNGQNADYYLDVTQLGKTVAPLVNLPYGSPNFVLPPENLPPNLPVTYINSSNITFLAQLTQIDEQHSPLRMLWMPVEKKMVLSTTFIVTKLRLLGNVEPNDSYPDNQVLASSDHLMRLKAGNGIRFKMIDLNSVEIVNEQGSTVSFSRATLEEGEFWRVHHKVFDTPGAFLMNLYETFYDSDVYTSESNHILDKGTPTVSQAFKVEGNMSLDLSDDILSIHVVAVADHFVYTESTVYNGIQDVTMPIGVDAIWWDNANNRYIVRTCDGVNWMLSTYDVSTHVIYPYIAMGVTDLPPLFTVGGANLYGIRDDNSDIILEEVQLTDLPLLNWTQTNVFIGESLPDPGTGVLKAQVNADSLVILNTGDNTIHVYSRQTNTKLYVHHPAMTAKYLYLWSDSYLSVSFVGQNTLFVTQDRIDSVTDLSLAPSIDKMMGATTCFAVSPSGGAGIMPDNKLWRAQVGSLESRTVYDTGECTAWLNFPYDWSIPAMWGVILNMTWKSMDISGVTEAKIAFYPGPWPDNPDTLYRWEGGQLVPFPRYAFPTGGQDLSIVEDMHLVGAQQLSYVLYFKRSADKIFDGAFIQNNFVCEYNAAATALPLPISGDGRFGTVPVVCAPTEVIIENNQGHTMQGLRLVVVPANT